MFDKCEICGEDSSHEISDMWAYPEDGFINFSLFAKTSRCDKHYREGITKTKSSEIFERLSNKGDNVILI